MSKPQRRAPVRHVPDGTPTPHRECGRMVIWCTSQYGSRVMLDAEPVADDDRTARYWLDWDAIRVTAMSWRRESFRPDGVGQPKYSAHLDTCPASSGAVAR